MPAEEMGKLTDRMRLIFAVSSVVFLAVLAISPFKDFRREWKQYKRSYLRLAQGRPDTKNCWPITATTSIRSGFPE
jgi:hypothetical protein